MPVALMYPSLLRRYITHVSIAFIAITCGFRTIRKYDSGQCPFLTTEKMPEPVRSLGKGTRRWA
jgi:hypothetical protein